MKRIGHGLILKRKIRVLVHTSYSSSTSKGKSTGRSKAGGLGCASKEGGSCGWFGKQIVGRCSKTTGRSGGGSKCWL